MPNLALPTAIAERRRAKDPLTIELNLEAPFRCRVALEVETYAAMREKAAGIGIGDDPTADQLRTAIDVMAEFIRACLIEADRERFDQGRAAAKDTTVDVLPDCAIDDSTLLELFRPLMAAYTGVPTPPAPSSGIGQESTGIESAGSPETPTLVDLD